MCNCERVTCRCVCRHKERKIQKCWSYQFKRENMCFAALLPVCISKKRHIKLDRLCGMCEEYFSTRYRNKDIASSVVSKFLDYKKAKGWAKKAVDPHMVARESYISVSDLEGLYQTYGQNMPSYNGYSTRSPMRSQAPPASNPRAGRPTQLRPPPQVHRAQIYEKVIPPYPTGRDSFELAVEGGLPDDYCVSGARSPGGFLPYHPGLVESGTSDPTNLSDIVEEFNSYHLGYHSEYPYQIGAEAGKHRPTLSDSAIMPELRHLATDRHRQPSPALGSPQSAFSFLKHPKPRPSLRGRVADSRPARPADDDDESARSTPSDITIIKNFTAMADTFYVPGYPNPESPNYPEVPQIASAPWIPSWRQSHRKTEQGGETASPAQETNTAPAPSSLLPQGKKPKPASIILFSPAPSPSSSPSLSPRATLPRHAPHTAPAPSSTYHVLTEPCPLDRRTRLARVLSPSHTHVVVPPPQLLEGVLVPATSTSTSTPIQGSEDGGAVFYRERGLPSSAHIRGCRSAPPVLVSVRAPRASYSCAVQATCFCAASACASRGEEGEEEEGEKEKCPSCAERERLSVELQMEWV